MCKLIVAVKQEGKNEDFKDAVRAQFNSMRSEQHGIGALIKFKDGAAEVLRRIDEDDYSEVYGWVITNINRIVMVSIHTRTMSTGERCLRNCHFFDDDGLFFAHNGFAGTYKSKGTGFHWKNDDWTGVADKKKFFGVTHQVGKNNNTLLLAQPPTEAEYNQAGIVLTSCGDCAKAHKGYCKKHKREGKIIKRFEYGSYYTEDELTEDQTEAENIAESERALAAEAEAGLKDKTSSAKLAEDEGWDDTIGRVTITDSEQFLKTLSYPITVRGLKADVLTGNFSGMGFLFDSKTNKQWIIVKKKCYVMLGKDFALFSSYDPQESLKEPAYNEVCGVLTDAGEKKIDLKIKKHSLIEGVYEVEDWK